MQDCLYPHARRSRRGATLILVLILLAVLGALAAGSFVAALHEERIESAALVRASAFAAAEHAAYTAIAPLQWRAAWTNQPPVRQVASLSERLPGSAAATTQIWMLTPSSALILADGTAGLPPRAAHRRVALLVSFHRPVMPAAAAVAENGLSLHGGSSIGGGGAGLLEDCLTPDSDVAAVSVPAQVPIDTGECTPEGCLRATRVVRDTVLALRPETLEQFGQVDRSFLASVGRRLAPGITLSPAPVVDAENACDPNADANLGDPLRVLGLESPCGSYFPVIHATGDLTLSGGAGQGMLVVDGNLTLIAGARFTGVLLVRGAARLEANSRLTGIVVADRLSLTDASAITYSACAVESASHSGARPFPETTSSWTEMF